MRAGSERRCDPRGRRRSVAKRVAPNEPTLRANGRPGMGRGRKDEVQSTKDEKGRSCGIEEVVSGQSSVVSGQFSVVSRLFSGDPQGSTFQLRNGERITNHESRKHSVAEQSHFAASSTWPERKAGRCLNRRMAGAWGQSGDETVNGMEPSRRGSGSGGRMVTSPECSLASPRSTRSANATHSSYNAASMSASATVRVCSPCT